MRYAWASPGDPTIGEIAEQGVCSERGAGDGVIYAMRPDGTLLEYIHKAMATGAPSWSGPHTVGTGWHVFKRVFAGENDGVVYAIEPDGDLLWYRHYGRKTGESVWDGPQKVGDGWAPFVATFQASARRTASNRPNGPTTVGG